MGGRTGTGASERVSTIILCRSLLLLLACRHGQMREGDEGLRGGAGEEAEGVGAKGRTAAQLGMT